MTSPERKKMYASFSASKREIIKAVDITADLYDKGIELREGHLVEARRRAAEIRDEAAALLTLLG